MKQFALTLCLFLFLGTSTIFSQTTHSTFLYFQSDEATLDAEDKTTISDLITDLEQHGDYHVSVIGHTDQDGSDAYNQELAKQRATTVSEYMIGLGYPEARMMKQWKGEQELVSADLTHDAKQQNRRVELRYSYQDFESVDDLTSHVSEDEPSQNYTIQNNSQIIDLDKGGSIYIPQDAFVHIDGSPITEKVQLEVIEAYRLTDIVANDLYTESKGELLETGGMLYINAMANGQQLELAENRSLEVIYPAQALEEGMELFYAEETEEGMTWVPDETPMRTTQVKNDPVFIDLSTIINHDFGSIEKPELTFEDMPNRPTMGNMPYPPSAKIYSGEKYEKLYANYEKNLEAWKTRKPIYEQKLAEWNSEVDRRLQKINDYKSSLLEMKYKVKLVNAIRGLERMQDRRAPLELIQNLFSFINQPMRINLDDRKIYTTAFKNHTRGLIAERSLEINHEGYLIYPKSNDNCMELRLKIFQAKKKASELAFLETGKINREDFGSYLTGISRLGWINCDRFRRGAMDLGTFTIAGVDTYTKHYLIYKNIRSVLGGKPTVDEVVFSNVAIDEPVKLVAIKLVDDKPYMAIKDMVIEGGETLVMDFFPCSLTQIREELNAIDPTVTDTPEETYDLSLKLFPNPTTDAFTALAQPANEVKSLAVYDLSGALIKSVDNVEEETDTENISIEEFDNGVYVVAATYDNGRVATERIVVQR